MHVAFQNNYLSLRGGSERVMFEEASMLRHRGHQSCINTSRQRECGVLIHAPTLPLAAPAAP